MRDNWVRSYKNYKKNERSGAGINKCRKYIYHDQLLFLEKVVEPRETTSNINLEDMLLQTDGNSVVNDDNDNVDVELISPQKAKRSKKEKLKNKKSKMDEFETKIINILDKSYEPEEVVDPNKTFFDSILPSLSIFDSDEILEFRIGVLNLIKNMKSKKYLYRNNANNFQFSSIPHNQPSSMVDVPLPIQQAPLNQHLFSTLQNYPHNIPFTPPQKYQEQDIHASTSSNMSTYSNSNFSESDLDNTLI